MIVRKLTVVSIEQHVLGWVYKLETTEYPPVKLQLESSSPYEMVVGGSYEMTLMQPPALDPSMRCTSTFTQSPTRRAVQCEKSAGHTGRHIHGYDAW